MSKNMKIAAAAVLVGVLAVGGYLTLGGGEKAAPMHTVNFGNNSWDALSSFELALAGSGSYEAIVLEDGKLSAGGFVKHTIPMDEANCTYDLRVTKENGDIAERPGVNLCAEPFYHFNDE